MNKSTLALCIAALYGAPLVADAANVAETEPNDSRAAAQNLSAFFTFDGVTNIFGSTTVPHVSVSGTNGSLTDVDYYAFTVNNAGDAAYFDIDGAEGVGGKAGRQLHTALALFDSGGNLLAFNVSTAVDPGSTATDGSQGTVADSFIGSYTFAASGTYYIGVTNGNWFDTGIAGYVTPTGTPAGALTRPDGQAGGQRYAGNSGPATLAAQGGYTSGNYTLHISLLGGAPLPVIPIPPTALGLIGLGLLGLGWRRLRQAPSSA